MIIREFKEATVSSYNNIRLHKNFRENHTMLHLILNSKVVLQIFKALKKNLINQKENQVTNQ